MVKGAAGVLHTPGAPAVSVAGMPVPSGGSSSPVLPSMSGAGTTQASSPHAPAGTLAVALGDMWIKAPVAGAKAGRVTFTVNNEGQMTHWFGIMRTPVVLKAGALIAKPVASSPQLNPGQSATVTATLAPGSYQLVCLMPGHYSAGQHLAFTVRG
jgi:uncharacterized cupredoxin-like copper-binding protein